MERQGRSGGGQREERGREGVEEGGREWTRGKGVKEGRRGGWKEEGVWRRGREER